LAQKECVQNILGNLEESYRNEKGQFTKGKRPKWLCEKLSKALKGRILSEETKDKIRKKMIGRKVREETRNKLREKSKGKRPLWVCKRISEGSKGKKKSAEFKEKCRLRMIGNQINKGRKYKNRKGVPSSEEKKRKLSKFNKGRYVGDKNHFWKGGITPLIKVTRTCFKYRQWRSDVFTRDDFTCQECGVRGAYLEAHHIKTFSKIIKDNKIKTIEQALCCEELWNINNGTTLCKDCHKQIIKL